MASGAIQVALLILGIILFLGLLPTVPDLRNHLIGRLGERRYRALFALLSVAAFVVLVWGFTRAPVIQVAAFMDALASHNESRDSIWLVVS